MSTVATSCNQRELRIDKYNLTTFSVLIAPFVGLVSMSANSLPTVGAIQGRAAKWSGVEIPF